MSFAAQPQHMAVSLRLTVGAQKDQEAMPPYFGAEAEPPWKKSVSAGKPEAFRYVLGRSPRNSHALARAADSAFLDEKTNSRPKSFTQRR